MHSHSTLAHSVKIICAMALFVLLLRCGLVGFSFNLNASSEANNLHGILKVTDSKPLYSHWKDTPYSAYLYPPLHAWLLGSTLRFLHVKELRSQVLAIRTTTFITFLVLLVLVWNLFHLAGTNGVLALLLASPLFADYAMTARNDIFWLLIEFGALAIFLRWMHEGKILFLYVLPVLLFLSFFARQTGLAVFIASTAWMFSRKQWFPFIYTSTVFLLLTGVSIAWLSVATDGQYLQHILTANLHSAKPLRGFYDLSVIGFALSYLLFFFLSIRGAFEKPANDQERFLRLCLCAALFIALLSFLRYWSGVNYFLEVLLLCVPFVAKSIGKWRRMLIIQSAVLVLLYGSKTYSTFQHSEIPYQLVADRIQKELPANGLITGSYSSSLNIYLRNWSALGPDLFDHVFVQNKNMNQLRKATQRAIRSGKVPIVVHATPGAQELTPEFSFLLSPQTRRECWYSWLCVYRVL